jgi:hypothetical protein
MRPRPPPRAIPEGTSPRQQSRLGCALPDTDSHVPAFIQQRLQTAKGMSIAAKDLRAAYEVWCAKQCYSPLTVPKLAAELKALGYDKWKSCGLIRYRGLQLVA